MNLTATKMKSVKIMTGVYVTPNGRLASRSNAVGKPAGEFFSGLPKSEARVIRKLLHAAGYVELAAEPRC